MRFLRSFGVSKKPVSLTIAGEGPCRLEWQSKARRLESRVPGLEVVFPGWINGETKSAILADTDLLVVPSVWPEPYGIVGDEAGALGVPATAFRLGGIPEWLADGVNGTLAPGSPPTSDGLADAVARALGDDSTYRSLRAGAMRSMRQRTMAFHCSDLLSVFGRVIAETNNPANVAYHVAS